MGKFDTRKNARRDHLPAFLRGLLVLFPPRHTLEKSILVISYDSAKLNRRIAPFAMEDMEDTETECYRYG